jgi:putative salt-induced outer membrane protein
MNKKSIRKFISTSIVIATMTVYGSVPSMCASKSNLQVSVVDTQGNTVSQTVSVDGKFKFTSEDETNTQELKAGLLYGEDDHKRTSEYYYGNIKDSHYATDWLYWYNLTGFEVHEFAGYDMRLSFNIGPGVRLKNEKHEFHLEAGAGLIYEERPDGDNGFISARAWEEYKWDITDRLEFSENAEYLYDYDDPDNYRVNGEAGLTGKITEVISFRIGPSVRYVNKPVAGKERTDLITKATIIFSF